MKKGSTFAIAKKQQQHRSLPSLEKLKNI